jgi:hypothetical protein
LSANNEERIFSAVATGHPDEDEIYESSLLSTNMVYDVHEDELVPLEKYWASIPKIQMLDPNKVRNRYSDITSRGTLDRPCV